MKIKNGGIFRSIKSLRLCMGNATDSYKLTHWKIYSRELTKMYSYLEARAISDFSDTVTFFGLQYFFKRYFCGRVITLRDLPRIKAFCKYHFMGIEGLFNEEGWKYIINERGGMLPVSIRAVEEGTTLPISMAMMTIENLDEDPRCAWLTNFLETILTHVWNPITVCSLSRSMKEVQYSFMKMSVDDALIPILMPSRVHDFGFRGVSSRETAAISGAAHLVNFQGTDNTDAIELITQFYCGNEFDENQAYDDNADDWNEEESYSRWAKFYSKSMPGFSIPATEHSQMTLGGPEGESDICGKYLKEFPNGFIACVSDSYDLFNCVSEIWGTTHREAILNRNGTLVIRPDSGDPIVIIPAILEALGVKFGFRINGKKYKVLNDKVRIIQGDGVNPRSHKRILEAVVAAGWSVENLAFGSGGALLQKVNRDSFSFAFKCSYAEINGIGRDVSKKPKTDPNKNSKKGRLALVLDNGKYKTVPESHASKYPSGNLLKEVFRNGELLIDLSFDTIRRNAEIPELR